MRPVPVVDDVTDEDTACGLAAASTASWVGGLNRKLFGFS